MAGSPGTASTGAAAGSSNVGPETDRMPSATTPSPLRIGILLSGKGRGSNMQALIDATRDGRIPGEVCLVVSTSPGTPALERARAAGVPTALIPAEEHPSPESLDEALAAAFTRAGAGLIC